MHKLLESFPAIADNNARILILGSMPGVASLQAVQYYAHPRNHFWAIINALFAQEPAYDYHARQQLLLANNLALWDVLQSCRRQGSLDSHIDKASLTANDFNRFLAAHPRIQHICFNGGTAAALFKSQVMPKLKIEPINYHRLPSTSPANARLTFAQKLAAWQMLTCLD